MTFSEEQKRIIETLSGTSYTVPMIAQYLDIPPAELMHEFAIPESEFRYHYDRGILLKEAERDISLSENAKNGSITAIQILEKHMEKRHLNDFKQKLLHGHQ
ncbi:MAG: hypothetical protein AB9842_07825 [Bacteroidales bacterium]